LLQKLLRYFFPKLYLEKGSETKKTISISGVRRGVLRILEFGLIQGLWDPELMHLSILHQAQFNTKIVENFFSPKPLLKSSLEKGSRNLKK